MSSTPARCRSLVFDAGNSFLKCAVAEDDELIRSFRISQSKLQEQGFDTLLARLPKRVHTAILSNVAGDRFARKLVAEIGRHCGVKLQLAKSEKHAMGVTNSYPDPASMGVDRWIAMIAAHNLIGGSLCIIDAGTAITIDALDRSGQHLGGQIIPGIDLMGSALGRDTSDIPLMRRQPRVSVSSGMLFANRTADAVVLGALSAACGAVDLSVRKMRRAGMRPKIVLTGGDASRILAFTDFKAIHSPNLVLKGLALMLAKSE